MPRTITVQDDGVNPVNQQKIKVTVPTVQTQYEGTLVDVQTEIDAIDRQVGALQGRKAELESIKLDMETEVQKLPPRAQGGAIEMK